MTQFKKDKSTPNKDIFIFCSFVLLYFLVNLVFYSIF